MDHDVNDVLYGLIPLLVIGGGMALAALAMYRVSRLQELKQRQVLAMIEKGMTPPPELTALLIDGGAPAPLRSRRSDRFRNGGIMVIGLGLAVGLIIGVAAGQPQVALGVGGAIVVLGVAMVVAALLSPDEPLARRSAIGPASEPADRSRPPSFPDV